MVFVDSFVVNHIGMNPRLGVCIDRAEKFLTQLNPSQV